MALFAPSATRLAILVGLSLLACFTPGLRADTTIGTDKFAYSANLGWIDARGNVTQGAVVGEFICSGFIYSANVGWISLGSGIPANGIRYLNNSASDHGVNTQDYSSDGATWQARLRGFAYSANVGWIHFESVGNPRLDLVSGRLLGHAYSANCGWISLSGTGVTLATTTLRPGTDLDSDSLPDAWERLHAGPLATLNAAAAPDGDGQTAIDEYTADTDPLDPLDRFAITHLVPARPLVPGGTFFTDLAFTSKPTRRYTIQVNPDLLGPWITTVADLLPDADPSTALDFPEPSLASPPARRFYRVLARLPLTP